MSRVEDTAMALSKIRSKLYVEENGEYRSIDKWLIRMYLRTTRSGKEFDFKRFGNKIKDYKQMARFK